MASSDKSQRRKVWVKYYVGDKPPVATYNAPTPNPVTELPEQTVYLVPELLDGSWMAFDISLPQTVQMTVGSQGWVYNSIWGVRLRGTVSVAPIVLSKSRTPEAAR